MKTTKIIMWFPESNFPYSKSKINGTGFLGQEKKFIE